MKDYGPEITGKLRILIGGYVIMQTLGAIVLSLVITNFIACASTPTDTTLKPYVTQFERIFNKTVNYPVYFKRFSEKENEETGAVILGQCHTVYGKPIRIELSKPGWFQLSPEQRKLLIFHEMGHCSLGLGHRNNKFPDHCPVYLMNPYMPSNRCISKYGISYYINSLRTQIYRFYRRR